MSVERMLTYEEVYGPEVAQVVSRDRWTPIDPALGGLEYRATRLADVTPERVRWLWPGRLPRGKVVTLDGDPSVGKSTLALDLAARLTTGRPMPGEDLACVPPSAVIVMSAEDGLADTIRPRLDAAGADPALVHHFDAVAHRDSGETVWVPPSIPDDLPALEQLIIDTRAVLVIVDVLMAYLSGRTDSHRDQDVRRALAQLAAVAERTGACILVVRHLRKSGGSALHAGGGSIAIIGAARAGLIAAFDPDDETGTGRVLAVAKSNLAAQPSALAYTLDADNERGCARIEWGGPTAHTADALVTFGARGGDDGALGNAVDWLRDVLSDSSTLKRDLDGMARDEGISHMTLQRARTKLGVRVERDDNAKGRPSTWHLDFVPTPLGTKSLVRNPDPEKPLSGNGSTPHDTDYISRLDVGTKPPTEGVDNL